jgi:DNA-binding NtrC family response regulator
MTSRVLIVDDEPVQCRLLEEIVRKHGHVPIVAEGGEEALAVLDGDERPVDVIILDLVMPGLDGMGVLDRLRGRAEAPPVIVQTAKSGVDVAVSAMRAGAFDFLVKPASPERIAVCLANAIKLGTLQNEIARMKRSLTGTMTFSDIVMRSPAMDRPRELGERATRSAIPVLLEGEPGVGKELFARAIQGSGPRRTKPFVSLNCGAIPGDLLESVLFGHEKGAFPGTGDRHIGKFQEAHGGTLYLDEIGELPETIQVKLLGALQDGEITPIGARQPVRIDFRLIAATDRRLVDLVSEGRFREDLFYRLNVFPIWLPPLRERHDDIAEMAQQFLTRFAAEEGKKSLDGFAGETINLLIESTWPGNIRQLENAVFRAVMLADGSELRPADFPHLALADTGTAAPAQSPAVVAPAADQNAATANEDSVAQARHMMPAPARPLPPVTDISQFPHYGATWILNERGDVRNFDALEEEVIRFALDHYRGRMSEVARRLGIGRSTLYRKLKDYGIESHDANAA